MQGDYFFINLWVQVVRQAERVLVCFQIYSTYALVSVWDSMDSAEKFIKSSELIRIYKIKSMENKSFNFGSISQSWIMVGCKSI